jgi:hypothetical protein
MKRMSMVLVGVVSVLCVLCGSAFAASTVASHATPALVAEINTALANPVHDSLTVGDATWTVDAAASGTFTENVILPGTATAKAVATRDTLLGIGDVSGTTAYGFSSASNLTYGVMMSFGRTKAAASTYSPGGFDSPLEVRYINRMTNNAACSGRGAHIKAKNYTSGTVGTLEGMFVEAVGDGTETDSSVIEMGTDSSTILYGIDMDQCSTFTTADIRYANGAITKNVDANTLRTTELVIDNVGSLQDDGIQVVVGNHATTRLGVEYGTAATNTKPVSFTMKFTAAPMVICGYDVAVTTNLFVAYPSSVTTNGFTVNCQGTKTANWFAIGPR